MNTSPSAVCLYSIIGASILIYLPFLVVAYARMQVEDAIRVPRAVFDKLPPYAQRATWAHQNTLEAFPIFAAAALMAYVTGVENLLAAGAAITFLAVRLLYSAFYILDIPLARSLMFGIGSLCSFTLFALSIARVNNII